MVATYTIEPDGTLRLPPEALAALGARPGDEVRLFIDSRKKSVRIERHSDDPWADALKEKPSQGLDELLAAQQKRQAEADDIFDKRLRESKKKKDDPDEKPKGDPDRWR